MELFHVVFDLAIVLTVLSALLIAVILGVHWREDIRIGREANFRSATVPVVENYLAGSARLEEAVAALKKNPSLAFQLLIERSETPGPGETERLRSLFKAFPFAKQAIAELRSPRWDIRLQNAQTLGYMRDESAIPELLKALEDEVPEVRLAAAQSLALLGCPDAVKPILLHLDIPGKIPPDRVVEVLITLGAPALEPLLGFLDHPQISEKALAMAVKACGMPGARQAVPRLLEALRHKTAEVRFNAVDALAVMGDSTAIDPITRLAEDPDAGVRNQVMRALGLLEASDHVPLLVRTMNDPAWEVRLSAARSLYQLGHAGKEALENAAGNPPDSFARSVSRQILQEHGDLPATAMPLL